MKRIVLFSQPGGSQFAEILDAIFPTELENKKLAFLPVGGARGPKRHIDFWRSIAQELGREFLFVDSSKADATDERAKLLSANTLLITGGPTFELLQDLRRSMLDLAIKDFVGKRKFVLAGFSAGAMVLSPSIKIAHAERQGRRFFELSNASGVEWIPGATADLTGLRIIDFEVFPHSDKAMDREKLEAYRTQTPNPVREITDEGYILLELEK